MLTIVLIISIIVTFVLITKEILKQEIGIPLLALIAVIIAGEHDGFIALQNGFKEFTRVGLLFTAVAVPAYLIKTSGALTWFGMTIGELIGRIYKKTHWDLRILIITFCLVMIYLLAAFFHNTTSILVGTFIVIIITKSYGIKPLPVLCATLVASNLGGFSTRWGDTPNIIEAATWNLTHKDFVLEIMPINIGAMIILTIVTFLWIHLRNLYTNDRTKFEMASAMIKFRTNRKEGSIDTRLLMGGLISLTFAIVLPIFFIQYEIIFSCIAIIIAVLFNYSTNRTEGLFALGIQTYAILISIFVLAQVLAYSPIGISNFLVSLLVKYDSNIWTIAGISYVGTLLTGAASWAAAAAPLVHNLSNNHASAWALGSGIFAGSSSLITAASAGIILSQETQNNTEDTKVTFGKYVGFGLLFSIGILFYYILILSLLYR